MEQFPVKRRAQARHNLSGHIGSTFRSFIASLITATGLIPAASWSQVPDHRCFEYDTAGRLIAVGSLSGQRSVYGLDRASNRSSVSPNFGVSCASAGTGVPPPSQGMGLRMASTTTISARTAGPGSNRIPRLAADAVSLSQWETKSALVLENDTDADNDKLEIAAATYDSAKVQVTRVKQIADGPYSYLDIVGISPGTTQIQYTVEDGKGGKATSFVDVTIK